MASKLTAALFVPALVIVLGFSLPPVIGSQTVRSGVFDEAAASGINYDKAEFRLWVPSDAQVLKAAVILVPGSNGDGRSMAEDAEWQLFARTNRLALVGCRFTDKPHEQNFIEEYVDASRGTGPALLDALTKFAARSKHPELAAAPLLLWGMSAGGEFNYEFVAWKPERVIAFVVNKGGIYYTALASQAARRVPGMLFVGGKDLEFRTNTIVGLFAVNRRAGAVWALAEEPGAAHIVGRSLEVAKLFFEDVLALRLPEPSAQLKPISETDGFIGDLKAKTFRASSAGSTPNYPTAWLPTERVARAWQAMMNEKLGTEASVPAK
jgi:poly(3-hydroxybutyrate) depolymerase